MINNDLNQHKLFAYAYNTHAACMIYILLLAESCSILQNVLRQCSQDFNYTRYSKNFGRSLAFETRPKNNR